MRSVLGEMCYAGFRDLARAMRSSQGMKRWKEIWRIRKQYDSIYNILTFAAVLCAGILLGAYIFRDGDGYDINIWTEALGVAAGAGVTVFVLDSLNERRNREREEQELKRRLIREAGSRSSLVTKNAVSVIREKEWIANDDGILKGANLRKADFRGEVDLSGANLQGTDFENALLIEVNLSMADVRGANLGHAHLELSNLFKADLRGANLMHANLGSARLIRANLQGAYLLNAKISGPFFGVRRLPDINNAGGSAVEFPPTILPDGTEYTPGISLDRYTNGDDDEFGQTLAKINKFRRKMGLYTLGNDTQQADCSLTNLDQQSHY